MTRRLRRTQRRRAGPRAHRVTRSRAISRRAARTCASPTRARRRRSRRSSPPRCRTSHVAAGPFTAATFAGADLIAISPGVAEGSAGDRGRRRARRRARRRHRALRARAAARAEGARDHRLERQDDGDRADRRAVPRRRARDGRRRQHRRRRARRAAGGLRTGRTSSCSSCRASSSRRRPRSQPTAATVLNVTENHLDRYAGIDDYAAAKARIFARRRHPGAEPRRSALARDAPSRAASCRRSAPACPNRRRRGASSIAARRAADAPETWLARGGALLAPGVGPDARRPAQRAQRARRARARVGRRQDRPRACSPRSRASKACRTGCSRSPTRAACCSSTIRRARRSPRRAPRSTGLGRPVVLIAGGDGKGQDFAPLTAAVDAHCRAVLLIGRDAPAIERALAGTRAVVEHAGTLDAAVARAMRSRGPATPCCCRRPARASTSSRTTSSAASAFGDLVRDASRRRTRMPRDACTRPARCGPSAC